MAFIRIKTVKGNKYGYLVKSVWNDKKNRSEQVTLKFLGANFSLKDIPKEYHSPGIKKYFSRLATDGFPPKKNNYADQHVKLWRTVRAREAKSQALRERQLNKRQAKMEAAFGMSKEAFLKTYSWRASL